MSWLSFFIGMIIGGGIVYYFWRSNAQEAKETEQMLRRRLTDTENETRRLTSQLDDLKRQEEQFATSQADLQKKTTDLQQVTEQLSSAESQIRSLRDQLAGRGTQGEQLSAAEAKIHSLQEQLAATKANAGQVADAEGQLQTLRDQLAAAEAKTETKMRQLSTAKAEIRNLRDQLAAAETKPDAVKEKPMPVAAAASESAEQPDDLTKIEGIGPKISQVLNENGIFTFAQLAHTEVSRLRVILQEAGPRFKIIEPESWPEQAGLAANGNWDALNKLQDELDGGKYRR